MKTFKIGGVHPSENKLSATSPIRRAGLPKQAVFSLYQHIGAPAKPVVAKGDEVKVGMMLAEADGFVSVPVHSSVSGKVSKIDAIVDASGYRRPAIFVDVEGDEWVETIESDPRFGDIGSTAGVDGRRHREQGESGRYCRYGRCHIPLPCETDSPKRDKSRMRYHQRRGVRTVLDSRPSVAVGKAGRNPGGSGSDS